MKTLIKLKWKYIIGKPIYDISESAAKQLGFTREDFLNYMNKTKNKND